MSRLVRPLFSEGEADVVRLRRLLGLIEDAVAERGPVPAMPLSEGSAVRIPGPTFAEMMAVVNRRGGHRTRLTLVKDRKP